MQRPLSKRWFAGIGVFAAAAISIAVPLLQPADVAAQAAPPTPAPPTPAGNRPDAPPLALEEKDAPGVAVTFTPVAGAGKPDASDTRVSRMLALFVAEHTGPTPFLHAGPFTAVFEGDVNMRLRDTYTFSAEGCGKVTVIIGEKTVLSAEGDDFSKAVGEPVRLSKGKNKITVKYESPATGDSRFRLLWTVKDEYYAHPVPPTQLTHNAGGEAVAKGMRIREGRQLFAELHCFNCHRPNDLLNVLAGGDAARSPTTQGVLGQRLMMMPELARSAPSLTDVGARLSKSWMTAWINNPHNFRPNPHMPRVFVPGGDDQDAIDPRAADVAAYLATLGGDAKADDGPAPDDAKIARGGQLFTLLNCIACHEPSAGVPDNAPKAEPAEGELPPPARIPLKYVKAKFKAGALAKFLQDPAVHYASIPMPNFHFNDAEAQAVAAFLLSQASGALADGPAGDPAKGMALIVSSGCVSCHALGQEQPAVFAFLDNIPKEGWTRGCMATDAAGRKSAPQYTLTDDQRAAIVAFAATDRSSLSKESPAEYAMRQVKSLNCNACHARDGKESLIATIYDAEHKELEGTYPPPKGENAEAFAPDQRAPLMTWFGEKLRPEWAAEFIAGKVKYKPRPYLHAKMPAFNVDASLLARGMAAEHGIAANTPEYPKPDPATAAIGSKLAGKTPNEAFSCVQCHAVNKQPALNPFEAPAVNFSHSRERLLKDYYHLWVHNPLRLDPNTKMPAFEREDAKTTITTVYEGDARKQFEAIWQYLLEGTEIKPPAE